MSSQKIFSKNFSKYPLLQPLLEIPNVPRFLNFKVAEEENFLNLLNKNLCGEEYKILTIVGSRKNTTYGAEALEYLLKDLVGQKIIIVSGLALGTDALAHRLALKYGFPTISFPGSGLNEEVIYPRANLDLAHEILVNHGLLISEHELEEKSQLYFFPLRNRLMAAISDAVLIVEASEKSGTLITARLAMEFGKNVGVIPNSIFAENSLGSNRLIQDGAQTIIEAKDIIDLLRITETKDLANLENNQAQKEAHLAKILQTLSEAEKNIFQLIVSWKSLNKDKLYELAEEKYELNPTEVLVILMNLEILDLIVEELGEIRVRN